MPNAAMPADAGMEIVGFFLLFVIGIYLLMFAFFVLCYILQSAGLYAIAKYRGIKNPWLAWIPVGNMWIMGSISDQYQYVVKGRIRNRRKWLMGLSLVTMLSAAPLSGLVIGMLLQGNSYTIMMLGLTLMFLSGLAGIVGVVATVMEYIALYDVYTSCDPGNAVLYLVLSILFPVALPFFLFFNRKKDSGMPPRKRAQQEAEPVLEGIVEE